jgi:hypothetical protein
VAHELEAWMAGEVVDIALVAGKKVVDAKDFITSFEQTINQVRPDKSRTTRNQNALSSIISVLHVQPGQN